jgi:hypothetical protein
MAKLPAVTPICAMTQRTYLTAACIGLLEAMFLLRTIRRAIRSARTAPCCQRRPDGCYPSTFEGAGARSVVYHTDFRVKPLAIIGAEGPNWVDCTTMWLDPVAAGTR